ncbi:hypothetical protein [Halodesulfovibrio sp.]|jgi:hypothetical protein|uniref:hypothetical protein n=1 Tax=Halodesulfovibrio sp. TaxID=1912772 RepID=UPI0025FDF610|nr:hypothetical protein [Halodesulfovibrio sp.]MCT4625852.1 hypothetical protein [Halodesulfovibrio sp.]
MERVFLRGILVLVFVCLSSITQAEIYRALLPQGIRTDFVIHHTHYSSGYDEESEQAE